VSTAEAPDRLLLGYRLDNGVAVVTVTGAVDVFTCGLPRDGLLRAVTDEDHRGLVVNLAAVSFIDSAGIGVLVGSLAPGPGHEHWPGAGRPLPPGPQHSEYHRPGQRVLGP
jgi:hypothetical protein